MMQQQQPAFIIFIMQSQHAWIISQHALSPDVQEIMHPPAVISHLHVPIIIEQVIIVIPFIIMQQFIIPPAIIFIMPCIIEHCILSSHIHIIFIPPSHFSIFIVQRGIIIMPFIPGIIMGIVADIIEVIGIISVLVMDRSLTKGQTVIPRRRTSRQPQTDFIPPHAPPQSPTPTRSSDWTNSHLIRRRSPDKIPKCSEFL
jgi:hypothetical protein